MFQIHSVFKTQWRNINGKDNQTTKLMPRILPVAITKVNNEVNMKVSGIHIQKKVIKKVN